MEALDELGEPTWFRLGDSDLAMHLARTHRLDLGESLSQFTDRAATRFGIGATILPMSDDRFARSYSPLTRHCRSRSTSSGSDVNPS